MKKQHRQSERERVFGKRLILRCKDMLSWVLVTLFNCRVGSFCDILLAFSASPHHIKLTYPRINCLNTHFLSSQLPTKLFWFPQKTGLRCAARRTVRELAGRRAVREGTGCSRQLSWLFHCLKNVIIALGFYKHGALSQPAQGDPLTPCSMAQKETKLTTARKSVRSVIIC